MCSKLELVEHSLWGNQQNDVIHSYRNLETECSITWNSYWKLRYKNFTMFGHQSEDSVENS